MDEIVFQISPDEETGILVACWDDPRSGGITTQGLDLGDLQTQISESVHCHFEEGARPKRIRLHFVADPVLAAL